MSEIDPREIARLQAVEAAVKEELAEPGHITKAEITEALTAGAYPPIEEEESPPPVEPPPVEPPPVEPEDPEPPSEFPTVDNTGVPANLIPALREVDSVTVSAGEDITLSAVRVTGRVLVKDGGKLTMQRVYVDNTSRYPIQVERGGELEAEECTVEGNTSRDQNLASNTSALCKGKTTFRRCRFFDCGEGPRVEGDDFTIEDSLVHELVRVPEGHHDCIQIRKGVGIVIRNNTLQAYNAATKDPMNAAIQIGSALGDVPVSGLVVEGNFMDGGNATVNGGSWWVEDAVYRNNVFGPNFRYEVWKNVGSKSRREGNRMADGSAV